MTTWSKFKAWIRLISAVAAAGIVLLIVLKNWNEHAGLWFFRRFDKVPVLWLIVVTSVASIIVWKVIGGIRGAYIQVRKTRGSRSKEG